MRQQSSSVTPPPPNPAGTTPTVAKILPPSRPQTAAAPEEEEGGENKIGAILEMVQRRSLVIVSVATVVILNSLIKLSQLPTIYEGDFQLLVEPVNAELAALGAAGTGSSNSRSGTLDYGTQLAILRSPTLLLPVIEELKPTYPNLNLGQLISNLQIRQLGTTKIIEVSFKSSNQALTQTFLEQLAESYLEYSLKERQTYLRQGLEFVNEQLKIIQTRVNDLQDDLQKFRQSYGFFNPEERSTQVSNQLGELDQTRLALEQELSNLTASLQTLQSPEGVQAILVEDAGYQEILTQIRNIDTQISIERSRFQDENIVIRSLKLQRDNLLPLLERQAQQTVQARLGAGSVQQDLLRKKIQNNQAMRDRLEKEVERLPILTREYNNLQRQLDIEVESLTRFLESRQTLETQAAQSEIPWEQVREPFSSPQESDFMKTLITKVLTGIAAGVAIAFMLDKLDGSFHTVGALTGKVKVPLLGTLPFNQQVFLAQEGSNAQGKKRKRKLLNRLRQRIIRLSQRFSTGSSKLAIALFEEYDGTVEFFESLRMIYTNIEQLTREKAAKTIMITSADVGDGKTTVAINLADTAAVMGKKVLLVDANFRKPEIHAYLNLKNEKGLNTIIGGSRVDPLDSSQIKQRITQILHHELQDTDDQGQLSLFQRVFPDRDLYLLSAGPVQNASSVILTRDRLSTAIEHMREMFDLIIFDVPCVLGLADSIIFGNCTDALVLVASLHKTSQGRLQSTVKELEHKGLPILGIVANRQKGAEPVLRATISQSNYIEYFPEPDHGAIAPPPSLDPANREQREQNVG